MVDSIPSPNIESPVKRCESSLKKENLENAEEEVGNEEDWKGKNELIPSLQPNSRNH